MRKLYAGLLAIILCGTTPMVQVAEKREETKVCADANGLRGIFVGFEETERRAKIEKSEYQLKQHLLFVPGLLACGEADSKIFKDKLYKSYSTSLRGSNSRQEYDKDRYVDIINVLKTLKNGNNFIEGIQEGQKSRSKSCRSIDMFIRSSSHSNKDETKRALIWCETPIERALVASLYVMSQSPKNLLEAFKYIDSFFPKDVYDYKFLYEEDRKILFPLLGAIIGEEKDALPSYAVNEEFDDFKSRLEIFFKGIELLERKKE